jgi:hypothetical protein
MTHRLARQKPTRGNNPWHIAKNVSDGLDSRRPSGKMGDRRGRSELSLPVRQGQSIMAIAVVENDMCGVTGNWATWGILLAVWWLWSTFTTTTV